MNRVSLAVIAVSGLASGAMPLSLLAQHAVTWSPGIAVGSAVRVERRDGAGWINGRHALLTVELASGTIPVRLRAEAIRDSERRVSRRTLLARDQR